MKGWRCKSLRFLGPLFFAAATAAGCPEARIAPVALQTKGVQPAVDYSDLASVLDGVFVTKRRERSHRFIDPDAAKALSDRLDTQLKRLAVTGPTITPDLLPTREAGLAYWYNARAAWSLKLAMLNGFRRRLSRRRFYERPFPLDGREVTLREIDTFLAADGDWRALAAAPCATLQRAHLPAEPFSEKDVRRRIAERIGQFIDDDERLIISVSQRTIYVPPVLWRFERDLRASYAAAYGTTGCCLTTALLPHVTGSPHRRLQDAIGYRCVAARESYELALEED